MKNIAAQTFQYDLLVSLAAPFFLLLFAVIIALTYSRRRKQQYSEIAAMPLMDGALEVETLLEKEKEAETPNQRAEI